MAITPIKAIRAKCLDCSGDATSEVKLCPLTHCPLYPFRLGRNPNIKPRTEEQRRASAERLASARSSTGKKAKPTAG